MELLKMFKGKSCLQHEARGDKFFQTGDYGRAKLEYESGLYKVEKQSRDYEDIDLIKKRLRKKLQDSKEALAIAHKQTGDDLLESGYDEDARQYYELALSLSQDEILKSELRIYLEDIKQEKAREIEDELDGFEEYEDEEEFEAEIIDQGVEYFEALCNSLPDEIRMEYRGYGNAFVRGYIALNRGDFETAVEELEAALEENHDPENYVPLELATAYLNLSDYERSRVLIEEFLERHPDILPAYRVRCEIYWEKKEFDQAESLLDSIPEELKESLQFYLLKGESLFRGSKYKEAETLYAGFIKKYGWNEQIALSQAGLHEATGEAERARDIYGEIISQCASCGQRISPLIKHKYADLSLLTGHHTTQILELYFSLVQDIPANAGQYYQKISQIYEFQGYEEEARRFQLLARKYR